MASGCLIFLWRAPPARLQLRRAAAGLLAILLNLTYTHIHRFGIRLVDSLMARATSTAAAEEGDGWAAPEWVLDVRAVTEAQVCAL